MFQILQNTPPKLHDPLRASWWLLLGTVVVSAFLLSGESPESDPSLLWTLLAGPWILWVMMLMPTVLVLPIRAPGVLYLRGFRSDEDNLGLLADLKRAVGRRYRLAGIRPPEKRSSMILKQSAVVCFCYRYAALKHFGLEASDEHWLPRLLSTLDDIEYVFINLDSITDWVELEIEYCLQVVGIERTLFVVEGDTSMNEEIQGLGHILQKIGLAEQETSRLRILKRREGARSDRKFVEESARMMGSAGPRPTGITVTDRWGAYNWRKVRLKESLAILTGMALAPIGLFGAVFGVMLLIVYSSGVVGSENVEHGLAIESVALTIGIYGTIIITYVTLLSFAVYGLAEYVRCAVLTGLRIRAGTIALYYALTTLPLLSVVSPLLI